MSNIKIENPRCELVSGDDVSHLEGKLKTLADATVPEIVGGDSSSQNKAIKDVIHTILWDRFNFITDHKTDHLLEKKGWYKEQAKYKENKSK